MVKQRRSCHQFSLSLSLPLYFQENKPSHAALISSKLSDLDALLRKGGAPEVQSTIHASAAAAHPVSGSAGGPPVVAHTHQQRTQQSREQGEGSSASASAAGVVVVGAGGGAWTTADCCAAHSEAHCTKRCDVGPCSRCATRTFMEGRKRPWKRVRGQGLVAWCLRWIAVGQCLAATHTWKRSCIEGVPPPKGKRGLLALCCCCGGCSKPDGGGGAE